MYSQGTTGGEKYMIKKETGREGRGRMGVGKDWRGKGESWVSKWCGNGEDWSLFNFVTDLIETLDACCTQKNIYHDDFLGNIERFIYAWSF